MKFKLYRQGYRAGIIAEGTRGFAQVTVCDTFEAAHPSRVVVRQVGADERRRIIAGTLPALATFHIDGSANHPSKWSGPGLDHPAATRRARYYAAFEVTA